MADISDLVGETLVSVENHDNTEIVFTAISGKKWKLHHFQDCCEHVTVEDITGDLDDLVGSPVLLAEEVTSREHPAGVEKEWQESFTWTFYKFATRKGYVDIRWYGESNGFYSERVSFSECFGA